MARTCSSLGSRSNRSSDAFAAAHASALPAGYEVGENSKTGLPFLRKA